MGERDKMSAKLKVFAALIERTCSAKLPISTYFKKIGLERLVAVLEADGYKNMDDLKCDDKEEYEEMLQEVQGRMEKMKLDKKLEKKEKKHLKKSCMKGDDTWVPLQREKEDIVRKSLLT